MFWGDKVTVNSVAYRAKSANTDSNPEAHSDMGSMGFFFLSG